MKANENKEKKLNEIYERDDDPSYAFNSIMSKDPISDLDDFVRNFSEMTKLNKSGSLVLCRKSMKLPNADENVYEYESSKCLYIYHMDDHEITLGTGTKDLEKDTGVHIYLYSGQVEGAFGLIYPFIDTGNITANISCFNCDHESCIEDEWLSNCDHNSCVEDELLSKSDTKDSADDETNSNSDTKKKVDDETNSNCDICLVENESVRLGGIDSISLDFVSHDHTYQPFCIEKDFCDIDSV